MKEEAAIEVRETVTIKVIEPTRGNPRVMEGARKTLSPVFDSSKGSKALLTGVDRKDWEKRYQAQFGDYDKFYEDFHVVLTNQTRSFDTSEPYNQLVVALLKVHPWVSADPTASTQRALYYIYDEVEEAKKDNKNFEAELKASKYLFDMSQVEKAQFLKLFGYKNTENVSPEVVGKRLKDKMKENPKLFVLMFEDKAKEFKIMIEELIHKHIVTKTGGVFYFGNPVDGTVMGTSIETVVEFMREPKHNDLMVQITRMLEDKKKGK